MAHARVKKYENPKAGERRDLCVRSVIWCSECSSHGLSFVHASALSYNSKASVSGAHKDGLNMISERSEAHSWFVLLLYVILHFPTSSPWSQRVDKQHQKSVQKGWQNPHGHVVGQTGHMTARQCLAHGSSDCRYIIQFLDGETGGKTQKNFTIWLKGKRTSWPSGCTLNQKKNCMCKSSSNKP